MLLLVLKRILLGFITLFIVSLITFSGVEVLPGDACTTYLEREAYGAALEACYERLGLNTPAHERYISWAAGVLQGDFGYSLSGEMRINDVLGPRVKNSMVLASASILIGIPIALLLGIITALWRDKLPDIIISTVTIFSMTIPEFISATLLILIDIPPWVIATGNNLTRSPIIIVPVFEFKTIFDDESGVISIFSISEISHFPRILFT